MPVVLYLRGLCHLHLSTGSPEDKLPRNKNTEKIICLPAARAARGERRAKGPLGFPTNAGKRRAEDSGDVRERATAEEEDEEERERESAIGKDTVERRWLSRGEKKARRFADGGRGGDRGSSQREEEIER